MGSFVLTVLLGAGMLFNLAHGQTGLTAADEVELLNAHHHFRGIVDPLATNMESMVWNNELAQLAQDYSEMCIYGHNADRHTQSVTYTAVGENLAITTADPGNYTYLVELWYNEVRDYNYDTGACSAVCGHYTQVVWATSNNIGCGAYRCTETQGFPAPNALFLVCNYGPSGNIGGMMPYMTGSESCSACPAEKPECVNNLCYPTDTIAPTPVVPQPTEMPTTDLTSPTVDPTTTPVPCRPSEFRCVADETCISNSQLCDGNRDCSDGADERPPRCDPIFTNASGSAFMVELGLYPAQLVLSEARPRAQLHYCVEVLSGALGTSVDVTVHSESGTFAKAGRDFRPFRNDLTLIPGAEDSYSPRGNPLFCQSVNIGIMNDRIAERTTDEYFYLHIDENIQVTTNSETEYTVVFIADDDIAQIGFTQSLYTVNEGDGSVEVCVRVLRGELGFPLNFKVSIAGGTATDGLDYVAANILPALGYLSHLEQSPSLPFDNPEPGTMWCVDIPILDDLVSEREESIVLELVTDEQQIVTAQRTVEVIIFDDDERQEFDVFLTRDTPRVTVGTVEVIVGTNIPATAECRLSRSGFRQTVDCTPGTTGTFTGIEPDSYTLKVTATSEEETKQIDMRLDVPASREECTVNLINRGIEISGSNATVSFAGVGPVTSYSCRFAGGSFYRCESPQEFGGLSAGQYKLRVIPEGCADENTSPKSFTVDIV